MQSYYEDLALKIVPHSHDRGRGEMRTMIAGALANEVSKALSQQREKEFPELAQVRLDLETQRKALAQEAAAKQEALDEVHDRQCQWQKDFAKEIEVTRQQLADRENTLHQQEEKLAALLVAFERYLGWLDGDGEVSENSKRFEALKEAYRKYKGAKK